ncbi:MAG: hypothetical protein R3180_15960 [Marinobacter sp.]|nr:hypothetical protein [Marinobacter sp.]
MKRFILSGIAVLALGLSAGAQAGGFVHPPGLERHADRGHEKKNVMQAHYRKERHERHRDHDRDRYRDDRHHRGYGHERHHHKHHRDYRHDHRSHHHDRYRTSYRVTFRYDNHIPPEYRVARIILDSRALIEGSHR